MADHPEGQGLATVADVHPPVAVALEPFVEEWAASAAPRLIGVSGAVAVGKSVAADQLADSLRRRGGATRLCADAFLFDNATLDALGLATRKGFPETYDGDGLRAALAALAAGGPVEVPTYSHVTYDIDRIRTTTVQPADWVVVDGLHLSRLAAGEFHAVVHLVADPDVNFEWYARRLAGLIDGARDGDPSFYAAFTGLDDDAVRMLARGFWDGINAVNHREHVGPWQERADVVVVLDPDHRVAEVRRGRDAGT